jgi:uncharacterized phiE125 gp8 family phage protein
MWLEAEVTDGPTEEPVSIEEARAHVNVEADCADFDTELNGFIAAARGHAEAITGTAIVTQTVVLRAARFCDLKRLPIAPLQSITSVKYLDSAGVEQTLSTERL